MQLFQLQAGKDHGWTDGGIVRHQHHSIPLPVQVLVGGLADDAICGDLAPLHLRPTAIAADADVPFQLLDVSLSSQLDPNCSLTNTGISMDQEKPADSYPNTFVPGRNMVFLTFAAILARSKGIFNLVTGVSEADFSGYPDCRDAFIKSLNVTLNLAMDEQFVLHTPLMWIDKAETWALADELGVLELIRHETLTCYNGIPGDGCGHCPACTLRREGLEKFLASTK